VPRAALSSISRLQWCGALARKGPSACMTAGEACLRHGVFCLTWVAGESSGAFAPSTPTLQGLANRSNAARFVPEPSLVMALHCMVPGVPCWAFGVEVGHVAQAVTSVPLFVHVGLLAVAVNPNGDRRHRSWVQSTHCTFQSQKSQSSARCAAAGCLAAGFEGMLRAASEH
jgi:hypothetical protein